ncbi:hypothetical protein [Mesobacillus zeae]|uniref:Zf-HC2 domain-containing protein n=1 Tax=Mesobacillus zeae TaxID=1917180 RepID=A0A398B0U1_9BACI|nr:hypothetical protein [Mesobacillus zeae]RID82924.1 hypothetical protein D1970_17690 [Mesobacillus zeae]
MNNDERIHLLAKELIPLYDDLAADTRLVVEEHARTCKICNEELRRFNATFAPLAAKEEVEPNAEIKPFKKLQAFKALMVGLLFLARFLLIGLLVAAFDPAAPRLLGGNIIMFYFPLAAASLSILYFFYRKLWFWVLVLFDVFILFFLDEVIYYLLL